MCKAICLIASHRHFVVPLAIDCNTQERKRNLNEILKKKLDPLIQKVCVAEKAVFMYIIGDKF
jgi:hypothetical protein